MRKKAAPKRSPFKMDQDRGKAIQLAAQGMTQKQIAGALGLSKEIVNRDLHLPKSQEQLRELRSKFRSYVMERTQAGIIQGAMGVVEQAISDGDAKSLELATRATVNLDKLTASASGETQKVEVSGLPPVTNVDLKVLITDLLGNAKRLGA